MVRVLMCGGWIIYYVKQDFLIYSTVFYSHLLSRPANPKAAG